MRYRACSGAHHLARTLVQFGRKPKLMAPTFVGPYRMQGSRGKNDANNAAAICEAVMRSNTRFLPIKTVDAQVTLAFTEYAVVSLKSALSPLTACAG